MKGLAAAPFVVLLHMSSAQAQMDANHDPAFLLELWRDAYDNCRGSYPDDPVAMRLALLWAHTVRS
jgi:hypothetical protein